MREELSTYIEVFEQQSFTKAAQKLNISQPTASLHVKRLEECFDARFILRSKKQKQLVFTEAGKRFYLQAKKMLQVWDYTKACVREDKADGEKINGSVRIGASLTIGEFFLPEFLGFFQHKYPAIMVEVMLDNTRSVGKALENFRIDVGIVEGIALSERFDKETVYRDELVIVVPKGWRGSLDSARWIIREEGSGSRRQWEDFMERSQLPISVAPLVLTTNFAVKEAVKNKLGVALLSKYIAELAAANKEIEIVRPQETCSRYFDLLLHKEGLRSQATEIFCREITTFFRQKQ